MLTPLPAKHQSLFNMSPLNSTKSCELIVRRPFPSLCLFAQSTTLPSLPRGPAPLPGKDLFNNGSFQRPFQRRSDSAFMETLFTVHYSVSVGFTPSEGYLVGVFRDHPSANDRCPAIIFLQHKRCAVDPQHKAPQPKACWQRVDGDYRVTQGGFL